MKTVKSLKSATKTEIFKFVATKFGNVNLNDKVYDFLKQHSVYGAKIAYKTAYITNAYFYSAQLPELKIANAISYCKEQINNGASNYSKVLIEGDINIYWASPAYKHSDYNKSICFPKTEQNLKVMDFINNLLKKHGIN